MIEISSLLLVSGIGLIFYSFYKWVTQNDYYFKKLDVPYLKPNFIFGNTGDFFFNRIGLNEFVEILYNSFPNAKISGFFNFMTPTYLIRDPEIFKLISVKEFDSFEDHKFIIDSEVDSLFGNTVFLMRGEKWRDMRATLSPAFTGSKMRLMFDLLRECIVDTMNHFREINPDHKVLSLEMRDVFARSSSDIIASCAFGLKINSFKDKDNEFYEAGKRVSELTSPKAIIKFIAQRLVPGVMKFFRIEYLDSDLRQFFSKMVLKNMSVRRIEGIIRPDMIDILMKTKSRAVSYEEEKESFTDGFATAIESNVGKAKVNRNWTDQELISQCFVFFLAGFDTVTQVMVAATYELILNPDVQQKLFEEIDETEKNLKGKDLSYEVLQKMRYMDMVVSEILRIRGPAIFLDRVCTKDFNLALDGQVIRIEKGSQLWIPIHCFHHDSVNFPEPQKFDPERFNEENRSKINPIYYVPFGSGPRNCIGSRFALMEVKTNLYYILKNYRMEVNAQTQIPIKMKTSPFGTYPEKGLHINLVPRY